MAYSDPQNRHQQASFPSRSQPYIGENGYGHGQNSAPDVAYQDRNHQAHSGYQQETFSNNQQYSQNYNPAWEQGQSQQHHSAINEYSDAHENLTHGQPRSYQYDDRFRADAHPGDQYQNGVDAPSGRRSPQSRPGTSYSGRRMKRT